MVSHHHQLRFPPAFRKRFFWWGHRSSGQRGFQQPSEADDGVGAHPGAEVSKGMDWWKGKSPISIFYIYINISIMYQYIVLNGLGSREWYLDSFGTNLYTCFFSTNVVWGRPLDFPLDQYTRLVTSWILWFMVDWLVVSTLWQIWVRQLGWFFPTEWKITKFHGSKPPTSRYIDTSGGEKNSNLSLRGTRYQPCFSDGIHGV